MNKCESDKFGDAQAAEFWSLGLGEPRAVSAIHGVGTAELLEVAFAAVPEVDEEEGAAPRLLSEEEEETRNFLMDHGLSQEDLDEKELDNLGGDLPDLAPTMEETINVAIVGRPNVGKSSLLNNIFGGTRAIVSDVAGTTRDSIDAVMVKPSSNPSLSPSVLYKFIDTAGIRKKGKVDFGPEFFMVNRALRAIRRADVCLLVLDSTAGVTEQDRVLAQKISDDGRACLVLSNKWDAVVDKNDDTYIKAVK